MPAKVLVVDDDARLRFILTLNLEGAANLPLSGDWAARISAQSQRRSDWVDNTAPGAATPKTEGYRDTAVRAQVLYEPHKQFSALANLHVRDLDGSPRLFRANAIKRGTNDLVDGYDDSYYPTDGYNSQTLKSSEVSARLRWDFDGMSLYSITAHDRAKFYSRGDVDGGFGSRFGGIPDGP